jgi:hypothetical protein
MQQLFALALLLAGAAPLFSAGFRAAAVEVDITPDSPQWLMGYNARQSTGVHDKIYHRIVAMDDGATQFYLVASDLCLFSPGVYRDVAATLKKELGIDPKNFWWSVTHSHAAPEVGAPGFYKTLLGRSDHEWNRDYAQRVTSALVEGIKNAKSKLEDANIAFGTGISMANINRRARDVDGRVFLGLNPDGPADRQINLIRIARRNGSPIAVIANYAMHGTAMSGANLLVSGDAPGTVSAYVEQKIGAPVLYVNGAAGNMAPIYSVYPDPRSAHLTQFNVLLGDRILAALNTMGAQTTDVSLSASEKIIESRRKDGLEWPSELAEFSRTEVDGTDVVRLPVRFLKINHTLVWSAPVELFCEIAIAVRNQSPFEHTFYFGYTNGWFGYLPTSKAFSEGGYEPKTSVFTAAAEQDLLKGVITYVQGAPR